MANKFLFIKLGEKGAWEEECIKNSYIKMGFNNISHQDCIDKKWNNIKDYYINKISQDSPTASRWVGELQHFYEEPNSTIWITFFNGVMWWCKASSEIKKNRKKEKFRMCDSKGWRNTDEKGKLLSIDIINGGVLKTRGYRGTICQFEPQYQTYLADKIAGNIDQDVVAAQNSLLVFEANITKLITKLNWQDFELLIDLLFSKSGWIRDRTLGKQEKTIEATLKNLIVDETACFQAKSQSNLKEFLDWQKKVGGFEYINKKYYFTNTFKGASPSEKQIDEDVTFYDSHEIAKKVIQLGLIDWVMDKVI